MSVRSFFIEISPLQQAVINVNGAGDTVILAGVAGKQIKVYRLKMIVAAATTILFKDGSTVIDGPLSFSANEGMVLDFTGNDMPPWYTTSTGNSLVMNCSVGVQVGGNFDYLVS
jgi:hypothetical protein